MLNQCNNCGGQLFYDIELKKLKCPSCGSTFDPDSYDSETKAEEKQDSINMTLYKCPACGAEISSVENAAVDYCLYCGSFVTLNQSMSKIKSPDYIIPFEKTKEQCRSAYKGMMKDKLYAPKEFTDDAFLDEFKGIYIPFWTYSYEYGGKIELKGEHKFTEGDYECVQKYNISIETENGTKDIAYDASSTFDDTISKGIVPFKIDNRKDFKPGYMFGFFGDTADVPEKTYYEDSAKEVEQEIWSEILTNEKILDAHPVIPGDIGKAVNLKRNSSLTMFPVWFLTWRRKDRIAYSVVNGQNENIYSEIPVSIGRYLLISLLTAIPIFLILNLLLTLTASGILGASLILSLTMLLLYSAELEQLIRREEHADDKGFLTVYHKEMPDIKQNIFVKTMKSMMSNFKYVLLIVGFLLLTFIEEFSSYYMVLKAIVFAVIPIYSAVWIYKNLKRLKDKTIYLDSMGIFIAYVLSVVVLLTDPAADMYYYVSAIISIIAIGISAIRCIKRYNNIITRPIPLFFDRKAGKQ